MSRTNQEVLTACVQLGGAVLLSLVIQAATGGAAHAQGGGETAAAAAKPEPRAGARSDTKSESKPSPKAGEKPAGEKRSVKENVNDLGRQASEPGTLQVIKAHEQELEKKVERRRASQRKDHGAARPSDAVDLAKSLDKPDSAAGAPAKASAKKEEATPAPAATKTPTATKPAPTK